MYNFSGIYYQMKCHTMIFFVAGMMFLLDSRFWCKNKRKIKKMLISILFISLAISTIIYYTHILKDPRILIHEGFFSRENRASKQLLKMEYSFSNEDGRKPVFYLDVLSKKEIFPEEFDTKTKYRIFYEEETHVIVKIEEIDLKVP